MAEQGFQQSQNLSLSQKLSPQMQQSLQVLQAPTLELRKLIQQELSENPVLEDNTEEISIEDQNMEDDDGFEEEFSNLSKLDDEWREYMAQSRTTAPRTSEQDEKRQFMFDSLVAPVTLQEHLIEQLGTSDLDDDLHEVGEMIIGSIDENGFLTGTAEDLCLSTGIPMPKIRTALEVIQGFHPVGIGAQDLRECLLIQLNRLDKQHSLEGRIVDSYLDDLAHKRYPQIAKRLGVTVEQISRAAEFIGTLNPKPGRIFAATQNNYITPDIVVERDGADYAVVINNEQIPHLRISNTYKDIMSQPSSSREARDYIRDKIRSGKFLIKSIHQRQDTIRGIAEEIVKRQREFFDEGTAHLKPMNMAQIADVVGVHETTVSRAIAGKYIATPHGVFEMKYFFKPGYETASGASMSNTSVKEAVAALVKAENQLKPLSDDKIVTKLKEQGITIARRTVAKYRDELNILPSHLRKTF
jgi:RNA polymerase sigma-54 factor